jgi:histidinol-phosphate phosphatase family protein
LTERRPAVFLDRDGTIIRDRHYLADPAEIELLPRASEGLRLLRAAGFLLVVATNQSGVGRGYFGLETLERQHERLRELLVRHGVVLDAIYACPHAPDAGCTCRKPLPGLIVRAAEELGIDLRASWVVGDDARDADAGRAAGTHTIVLGSECPDLVAAAAQITAAPSRV